MERICHDPELLAYNSGSLYESCTIPGEIGDSDIEFISFCGGGVAGISLIGAIQELETRGLLTTVKYWIGSSAGAIAAAFAALGASSSYLKELALKTDLQSFLDFGGKTTNSKSWWRKLQQYKNALPELILKFGAARGDKFRQWFSDRMVELGWSPETTFADLYNKTGKHLIITVTSLNTLESLYLSRSSSPEFKVLEAVNASIKLPFLFQPIKLPDLNFGYSSRIIVDGGLLDNNPINVCDPTSESGEILAYNRKAIGFILVNKGKFSPESMKITNLFEFFMAFVQAMRKKMQILQSKQPYFWDRMIKIETNEVETTEFDISLEKITKLIESGKKSAREFFERRAAMIKLQGPLPRNLFIPNYRLQSIGIKEIPDDFLAKTLIYQTNPSYLFS